MVKGKSSQRVTAASAQRVVRGRDRAEPKVAPPREAASGRLANPGRAAEPGSGHVGDTSAVRSERIELRATPQVKALLQHAAALSQKNVTAFLLDAGIAAAEEVAAEQRIFRLSEAEWQAFESALDQPATSKPRLAELLREKSVLE